MNQDVNANSNAETIFVRPRTQVVRYLNFEPVLLSSDDCFSFTGFSHVFRKEIETSTVFSTDLIIQELIEFGFELSNPDEIAIFIGKNQSLKKVLSESKSSVGKYFEDFDLLLTYFKDEEEESENLGLSILHSLDLNQAFLKENDLFDNWFEEHYIANHGLITLREYSRV